MSLTRAQVARRIGRSISTVRKLEGTLLHPERDSRGVHRFRSEEVEKLALIVAKSGRALPRGSVATPNADPQQQDNAAQPVGDLVETDEFDEPPDSLSEVEDCDMLSTISALEAWILRY